jgi:hypothetical protein
VPHRDCAGHFGLDRRSADCSCETWDELCPACQLAVAGGEDTLRMITCDACLWKEQDGDLSAHDLVAWRRRANDETMPARLASSHLPMTAIRLAVRAHEPLL